VPETCRNTLLLVPVNFGWLFWGWPNLFFERMNAAGTEVFITGPYASGEAGTSGIDNDEIFESLPEGFSGGIWTNRIDRIAPKLGRAPTPTP
jgi:glycerophosphoryl diester phosphodiesterase